MAQRSEVAGDAQQARLPRLLICEGPKDVFFFRRLIEDRKLPHFHIRDARGLNEKSAGNTGFARAIRGYRLEWTNHFENALKDILLVADNDEDPDSSFKNVCRQIEEVFGKNSGPAAPLQKTKTKPAVTVLMLPWTGEQGNLECLCREAADAADRRAGGQVSAFMGMIAAERWKNVSRFGKAWLRVNLAARCTRDPFIPLGFVFHDHKHLIPVDHKSLDRVAGVLASFA